MKPMIYLDNNATTPLAPEVFEVMRPFLTEEFGNPSSAHAMSNASAEAIAVAREQTAGFLGTENSGEIVFTSGGTESDNWAILGTLEAFPDKKKIITTKVEHEAVRVVCEKLELNGYNVVWLDVDSNGALDRQALERELDNETAVVSIMLANNETGVVFPVEELSELVKSRSAAAFHVDGVNAAGKIPINLKDTKIDLFSISGHKFHGPKGSGALYIRDGVRIASNSIGGGQESGRRAGTEAVHQIAGLGAAAELASDLTPMNNVSKLRNHLEQTILQDIPNTSVTGETSPRIPNTSNVAFEGLNGELILAGLNEEGICVSTGSACNEANHVSSPVLRAMDIPYSKAMGTIRFSLGRQNTREEIDQVIPTLKKVVSSAQVIAS
ncbi:MAG: aminotransferase class V-fold PLP-dependent enzyme [Pyrinomonadaceae bacterium]|nr:aminotransferase class V-fold PLP-dependent enzyme [Pyrinomonadaceae bacterium]